jgi:hypothetical protein
VTIDDPEHEGHEGDHEGHEERLEKNGFVFFVILIVLFVFRMVAVNVPAGDRTLRRGY